MFKDFSGTLVATVFVSFITLSATLIAGCARPETHTAQASNPESISSTTATDRAMPIPGEDSSGPDYTVVNGTRVDHSLLPDEVLLITGIDIVGIPPRDDQHIHHDWFNDLLYFRAPITTESLVIEAMSPAGIEFNRSFSLDDPAIDLLMFGDELPAFGVPFNNYAGHPSGTWHFKLMFPGGSVQSGELWIDSSWITLSSEGFPDPFSNVRKPNYSLGETLHVYLSNRVPGAAETLAIYRNTEKLDDLPTGGRGYVYTPVYATTIEIGSDGIWQSEVRITEVLSAGDYRFAVLNEGEIVNFFGFHWLTVS